MPGINSLKAQVQPNMSADAAIAAMKNVGEKNTGVLRNGNKGIWHPQARKDLRKTMQTYRTAVCGNDAQLLALWKKNKTWAKGKMHDLTGDELQKLASTMSNAIKKKKTQAQQAQVIQKKQNYLDKNRAMIDFYLKGDRPPEASDSSLNQSATPQGPEGNHNQNHPKSENDRSVVQSTLGNKDVELQVEGGLSSEDVAHLNHIKSQHKNQTEISSTKSTYKPMESGLKDLMAVEQNMLSDIQTEMENDNPLTQSTKGYRKFTELNSKVGVIKRNDFFADTSEVEAKLQSALANLRKGNHTAANNLLAEVEYDLA